MAHPYSTEARLRRLASSRRVVRLLDRDKNGKPDTESDGTSVIADTIERACNSIDLDLSARYTMPCAAVTDVPPTPGVISDLCDLLVVAMLWEFVDEESKSAKKARDLYDAALERIRDGETRVPGLSEAGATTGRGSVAFESIGTTIAGATDSVGQRTAAWSPAGSTDQGRGI